jgi:general secretion pathway protein G
MSSPHSSSLARKAAFTLLEIMLVIVIIGVVATIAVTNLDVFNTTENAKRDTTMVQIGNLANAVETYRLHTGKLPSSLNDLVTNPGIKEWRGPYQKKLPKDRWGDEYSFSASGNQYEIRSNAGGSEKGPLSSNDL